MLMLGTQRGECDPTTDIFLFPFYMVSFNYLLVATVEIGFFFSVVSKILCVLVLLFSA